MTTVIKDGLKKQRSQIIRASVEPPETDMVLSPIADWSKLMTQV